MGFEMKDLWDLADALGGTVSACLYGSKDQLYVITEILEDYLKELEEYFPVRGPGSINEDLPKARAIAFLRTFSRIAPLFKNRAFSEEEEIRMVFDAPRKEFDLQFRCGEIAIVPYRVVSLTLPDQRIVLPEVIYIKSTSEGDLTRLGADQFLRAKGISRVLLENSQIPYREKI